MSSVNECRIIELPKIIDPRGNLSFLEGNSHAPFEIKRTYWIYDVPGGEERGGHSYINNQEFIVALSGSFDIVVDDGTEKKVFSLNRSYYGLYVPNGLWRGMENFSTNSLAFVVASEDYDEKDYIRDYKYFLEKNKI
ncbi:FdtA/QdtA family cupin domain-containing protein [Pedobacter nyackensis]|uniref:sugar 3,4-ketoisomerase n=1 Tax=Pedobacter nyackensis TaxID=475255 RepID=UPI00292E4F4E|nr:FdtA/QdtA family cupin domain-containing protein [Pedobacter nyackensis]